MNNIAIYDNNKTDLAEVAFVRDVQNQTRISKMDSYEFKKQVAHVISDASLHIGLTVPILDIYKTDIKEMILRRFKALSLNEIAYAFKLERYGTFGAKTEHYQEFNAQYVMTVIEKYINWKRETKIKHNISAQQKPMTISEQEKKLWVNKGVTECLDYFEEHRSIMGGKIYVYDVFFDEGMLPTDVAFKNKMYAEAKEVVEFEQSNKKATSRDEKIKIKNILKEIQLPKSGKVISKAKEMILAQFLRDTSANEKSWEELKEQFRN